MRRDPVEPRAEAPPNTLHPLSQAMRRDYVDPRAGAPPSHPHLWTRAKTSLKTMRICLAWRCVEMRVCGPA